MFCTVHNGITTKNFFTSLELSELWKKNMTSSGTLKKIKHLLQGNIYKHCIRKSTQVCSNLENRTLVPYGLKKNFRHFTFILLEHADDKIAGEERSYKSDIILHYTIKGADNAT